MFVPILLRKYRTFQKNGRERERERERADKQIVEKYLTTQI